MYAQLAPVYDHFVNWKARLTYEMPLIFEHLRTMGKDQEDLNVLDAACGTGHHAIAVAKAGYRSSGADISPEMVSIAKGNATAADVRVDFRTAGFGQLGHAFRENAPFQALMCLGNSLPHVSDENQMKATLQDFASVLEPDGLLIIQQRNFDQVMQKKQRWMEPQYDGNDKQNWTFFRFYDFEKDGRIRFNVLTLEREGQNHWDTQFSSTHLFPIVSSQLSSALNKSFKNVKLYGNLAGEAFNPDSSSDLVVIASRA